MSYTKSSRKVLKLQEDQFELVELELEIALALSVNNDNLQEALDEVAEEVEQGTLKEMYVIIRIHP